MDEISHTKQMAQYYNLARFSKFVYVVHEFKDV